MSVQVTKPGNRMGQSFPDSDERERAVTSFIQAMFAIIWKDLAAEWRSRELLSSVLVFSLLVIFIFNFALELDPDKATEEYKERTLAPLRGLIPSESFG